MTAAPDRAGRLRIHYAVVDDNIDELKECIASGQDVNAQEGQGWTPLHFAANMGNLEVTKYRCQEAAQLSGTTRAILLPAPAFWSRTIGRRRKIRMRKRECDGAAVTHPD